tara:strand:- start:16 stop:717 length:702 start_codon:yes stop_codon:yes gene_type:complete
MDLTATISGSVGGTLGILTSHPIDTVKVLYQSKDTKSIINTIKDIYNKFGYKGFYRGIIPPLLGFTAEKACVIGSYEYMKKKTNNIYFSSLWAGFICTFVISPMEKIKINMQNGSKNPYRNLHRGWLSTVWRETPSYVVYLVLYEKLKERYNSPFLNGAISGTVAWLTAYPADTVKTLCQEYDYTIREATSKIYKAHGFRGFFRGVNLALARAFILHGFVFTGIENTRKLFER